MSSEGERSDPVAVLAEEITTAVHSGRPAEWIEARLLSALQEATRGERERCAALAERRAQLWQQSKLNDPAWPAAGRTEARERYKEALAIADAIRAGELQPPLA